LDRNLDAKKIRSILEIVAQWSASLRSEEERSKALASLIDRAEVAKDGFRLSIRVPLQENGQSPPGENTALFFKRHVPLQVRRRGIEMRLVVGGGADAKVDSAILKAVARANQWLTELLCGRSDSLVEIGKREGVGGRYVSRIIRLAFLAPSILEEITLELPIVPFK
jgi:site-specific DNA recombinase